MQIQITGRHVDITDAIKDFINKKFARLEKHHDNIINAHALVSVEKGRHIAEATINIAKHDVFAEAESENMYAAIDLLLDKLDRQLIKYKEKTKSHAHEKLHSVIQAESEEDTN